MNRIQQLRKEKEMTQEDLAKILNINRSVVSKYESEDVPLTADTIITLTNFFNVTTDYLLCRSDTPTLPKEKTKYEKIISKLPLYNIPVSAGDGQWLAEGNEYEYVDFAGAPKDTDFALKVRGDSMEPMYFNDDIVFVKTCVQVESGQIGAFFLNGEGYLKMLQGNRLVSLNRKYEPITIGEYDTFFICGRVLGKREQ
ncbi:MAG: XRE family transcriptional regulator [Oscillospiraceae bacterium]|nr:XRE family transcriptional regulator [Oscillospiraceae bacterium]